ncbi:MAG: hypothetical protein ACKVU4_05970 [Phycisphaerales bacterium]
MVTRTAETEPVDDGAESPDGPRDSPPARRSLTTEDVRAMADEALRELCGELPTVSRAHPFTPEPVASAGVIDAETAAAGMPRLTAGIGRTLVAAFTVGLTAQFGAGLVAAAGGAGVVFVAARAALHNGMDAAAAVMAFAAFVVVAGVWCPAGLQLASRAAWRAALRDHSVARAMAEGIAAALLPGRGDAARPDDPPDSSVHRADDASGLGLYPLADRVRGALEQALTDTIRVRWIRRFVAGVAARNTDRVLARHLASVAGPTGDEALPQRDDVRLALANAVESALVGRE